MLPGFLPPADRDVVESVRVLHLRIFTKKPRLR